jgi:hypothetical protein
MPLTRRVPRIANGISCSCMRKRILAERVSRLRRWRASLVRRATWLDTALETCDAAVMIGGRVGAFSTAQRFLDAGKPVFPTHLCPVDRTRVFQDQ